MNHKRVTLRRILVSKSKFSKKPSQNNMSSFSLENPNLFPLIESSMAFVPILGKSLRLAKTRLICGKLLKPGSDLYYKSAQRHLHRHFLVVQIKTLGIRKGSSGRTLG